MLFMLGCVMGFGQVAEAWFVTMHEGEKEGAFAYVLRQELPCGEVVEPEADMCAFVSTMVAENPQGVWMSSPRGAVMTAAWWLADTPVEGRSTEDLSVSPCMAETVPELGDMEGTVVPERTDTAVSLAFTGALEGTVLAEDCGSVEVVR